MTDITMHLTANFYPPIPQDIKLRAQEIFDELIIESEPYILGGIDEEGDWQYQFCNTSVFNREYELPNGKVISGWKFIEELRLWDALWDHCEEPQKYNIESMTDPEVQEIPGQLEMEL